MEINTKLSVASIVSFMMAVWFCRPPSPSSWAAGSRVSGTRPSAVMLDPAAALATSLDGFNKLRLGGRGLRRRLRRRQLLHPALGARGRGHSTPNSRGGPSGRFASHEKGPDAGSGPHRSRRPFPPKVFRTRT